MLRCTQPLCFSFLRKRPKSKFDVVDLKPRTDPSSQAAVLRIHSLLKAISQKQNKQLITGMLLVFSTVSEVGSYLNVTKTI